ncbi:MAG: hypothetical protein VKL42_00395 [Snowella sp.]|nr:hypothetical protein [Snowella sp.]
MAEYCTRITVDPLRVTMSWIGVSSTPETPNSFDWQYQFQDGSRLVGQVKGKIDPQTHNLNQATHLQASYIGTDGRSILLQWQMQDFAIFEAGKEQLIIASNDNFVSNSVSLVACPHRSCAQVTHWGMKLVSEPFRAEAWSFVPTPQSQTANIQMDWIFSPCFPFLGYRLDLQPPLPQKNYPWTVFPCLGWVPRLTTVAA